MNIEGEFPDTVKHICYIDLKKYSRKYTYLAETQALKTSKNGYLQIL
jgi:hypothetical protein